MDGALLIKAKVFGIEDTLRSSKQGRQAIGSGFKHCQSKQFFTAINLSIGLLQMTDLGR